MAVMQASSAPRHWRCKNTLPEPRTCCRRLSSDPTSVCHRRFQLALVLPEPIVELWEQRQGVIPQDLPSDPQRVFFLQAAGVDLLSENFRHAATREFGRAINSLGVVAVCAPHNPV